MKYDFDLDVYRNRNLPTFLRRTKIREWMHVLLKPGKTLYDDFKAFVTNISDEMSYNGQKIMMEYMLNKKYPAANGYIYIENLNNRLNRRYIFKREELEAAKTYIYPRSEFNALDDDKKVYISQRGELFSVINFIVWVPDILVFDQNTMKALVSKYTLLDKNFAIQTFTL